MRMVTCDNGHYYDQEKNATCPYCASSTGLNFGGGNTSIASADDSEKTALYQAASSAAGDEEKTVYHSASSHSADLHPEASEEVQERSQSNEPILLSGWLAIISEKGRGLSYTVTFGMNTIGRSSENHISIQNGDSSISREKHAIIIYDYDNNIFYIKHGDGQFLSYVNGEVLLDTKQLKANDKIKIGSTELIFIPLCSENFNWES